MEFVIWVETRIAGQWRRYSPLIFLMRFHVDCARELAGWHGFQDYGTSRHCIAQGP